MTAKTVKRIHHSWNVFLMGYALLSAFSVCLLWWGIIGRDVVGFISNTLMGMVWGQLTMVALYGQCPFRKLEKAATRREQGDLTGYRTLIKVCGVRLSPEVAIPLLGVGVALVATAYSLVMSCVV